MCCARWTFKPAIIHSTINQSFIFHHTSAHCIIHSSVPFFVQGSCSTQDCPYLHVNLDQNAEVCRDFLDGYCAKGKSCAKKHLTRRMLREVQPSKQAAKVSLLPSSFSILHQWFASLSLRCASLVHYQTGQRSDQFDRSLHARPEWWIVYLQLRDIRKKRKYWHHSEFWSYCKPLFQGFAAIANELSSSIATWHKHVNLQPSSHPHGTHPVTPSFARPFYGILLKLSECCSAQYYAIAVRLAHQSHVWRIFWYMSVAWVDSSIPQHDLCTTYLRSLVALMPSTYTG